ncbi:hypothetical protein SLS62_008266 [Diatrype stigma]|uniref:Ecp2 effector protein domain-containing protein n=1 Tax=Diatrype stigma TaxID=117547 RepID=A0AAN9YNU9_9PEZI
MRSSAVITSIFALATAVSGAAVKQTREMDRSHDGVYNAGGRVADLSPTTKRRDAPGDIFTRAQFKGVSCDHAYDDSHFDEGPIGLDPILTRQAEQSLIDWCNKDGCTVSTWAKAGFTVVYYCQWRTANWNIDSFNHALNMIDSECALNNAGQFSNNDDAKRDYTYGVTDWSRGGWCNMKKNYPF